MAATSRTIVRAWTAEGYHKDILIIDSDQVRMYIGGVKESSGGKLFAGNIGPRMVIDPSEFPEMVEFEIIVEEYKQ